MFDFFQKSLRNKILVTFIAIGFLPFLTLLTYTLFLSETKIVNKIITEQFDRTSSVLKLITNHVNSLTKEVNFISSLDVMDDILADDIDKRISRLLTQKSNDLSLENTFMVVNSDFTIISSSDVNSLLQKFDSRNFIKQSNGKYIENKTLCIYSKIYASFDNTKEIGFLVLKYNLDNLDLYLTHQGSIRSYIINPKNAF